MEECIEGLKIEGYMLRVIVMPFPLAGSVEPRAAGACCIFSEDKKTGLKPNFFSFSAASRRAGFGLLSRRFFIHAFFANRLYFAITAIIST